MQNKNLVAWSLGWERTERHRIQITNRLAHLAKLRRCLACNARWSPVQVKTRCPNPECEYPLDDLQDPKSCPNCDEKLSELSRCPHCGDLEYVPDPQDDPFMREEVLPPTAEIEITLRKRVTEEVQGIKAWEWLKDVKGIGPANSGRLLGCLDFDRANTPTRVWSHCGYGLKNGKPQRKRKNEKIDFCQRCRKACYLIAKGLMMAKGKYYQAYSRQRAHNDAEGMVKGHAHNDAKRRMMKLFLSNLYAVAVDNPVPPYAIAAGLIGGGTVHTEIPPEDMTG